MKAFKLFALTSCFLLAAGNGVAQRDYSKSEGLLNMSTLISVPAIIDMYLWGQAFLTAWYSSVGVL